MTETQNRSTQLPGRAYYLAGASFAPVLGFLAAAIAMIVAIRRGRARIRVVLLAAPGLLFNLWLAPQAYFLWHLYNRPPTPRDEIERQIDQEALHSVVRALEYSKQVWGKYPVTLQELEKLVPTVEIRDTSSPPGCRRYTFRYVASRQRDSYELSGIGPDCTNGTEDDVYPELSPQELEYVGIRLP